MRVFLAAVWLVVFGVILAAGSYFTVHNAVYAGAVRYDIRWDSKYREEMAVVVWSAANPLHDMDGYPTMREVRMRYRKFNGGTRVSNYVFMPYNDHVGTLEPVIVSRQYVWFENTQIGEFESPLSGGSAGLANVGGWIVFLVGGLIVATAVCWLVYQLVGLLAAACRAGKEHSLQSLVRLARRRLNNRCRTILDFVVRYAVWAKRFARHQPLSVHYRKLYQIRQILRRMDQTDQLKGAITVVATAMQIVLERDQAGRVEELAWVARMIGKDASAEVLARRLVNGGLADKEE